jgi:hypothetical protein
MAPFFFHDIAAGDKEVFFLPLPGDGFTSFVGNIFSAAIKVRYEVVMSGDKFTAELMASTVGIVDLIDPGTEIKMTFIPMGPETKG